MRAMHFRKARAAFKCFSILCAVSAVSVAHAQIDKIEGVNGGMPVAGDTGIRMLTPSLVEVARINTKPSPTVQGADTWNFVTPAGVFTAPAAGTCVVKVDGTPVAHTISGFRRRVLHAPMVVRDIRIDNRIFIQLAQPVAEGSSVSVETVGWESSGSLANYTTTLTAGRRSPAVHTNHEGYQTIGPKQAMVGYFLGNLGELAIPSTSFSLVDDATGTVVHTGTLTERKDVGFAYSPIPHQQVWQADFSSFTTPGKYRLMIPGLGGSLSFRIADDMLMNFVRSYAQGLYNQRCGHAVELPYGRHTHAACHTAMAEIPTAAPEFGNTWHFIDLANAGTPEPRMVSPATQLYPILKTGSIDVSGGHHDAGDYSKYTVNSAQLIHSLVFAADSFPGAGALDNLGLPESGDGKSDLLQEAKIEADFLAKMQDDDGGFFFLVYPKNRKYENDVLPDQGDTQVVWPKNTAVTAAAVGALADMASSPLFQQQFPVEAALYLQKAQAGWNFLINAIATHGKAGAYQTITHYGGLFTHDDELAWAAAAMFAATGNPVYEQKLIEWYDPSSPDTVRWGWWELIEGYGCAARSYGFAVKNGKRLLSEMNPVQYAKTQTALIHAGDSVRAWSAKGAYGNCLDDASKRWPTAGWHFASSWAYDITVGEMLQPAAANKPAVFGNMNFEFGCNPVNVSYVTGSGQRQQREIVHQYAQNDKRVLPPSGIPLGSLQTGFSWNGLYNSELGQMTFPHDGLEVGRYAFYDRWADTYNVTTEFVIAQQGRSLGSLAAWAASTPGASQPWKPQPGSATISLPSGYLTVGVPVTATVQYAGLDLTDARVIWECGDQEPWIGGKDYTFTPVKSILQWIEAEVVLPDGRRFSAAASFGVKVPAGSVPLTVEDDTIALYHFDTDFNDSAPNGFHLVPSGAAQIVEEGAVGWMTSPSGKAVRFRDVGDALTVTIPDSFISPSNTATPLALEAWICPVKYKSYGKSNESMLGMQQGSSRFTVGQDMWLNPKCPFISTDGVLLVSNSSWNSAVQPGVWQHLKVLRKADGTYEAWLDGALIGSGTNTAGYGNGTDWKLTIGNFDGFIDEVRISGGPNHGVIAGGGNGGNNGGGNNGGGTTTPPPVTPPPPNSVISPFNVPFTADADTIALYNFDGSYNDLSGNGYHLTASGSPTRVPSYASSGVVRGEVLRLRNAGDALEVAIPDSQISPGSATTELTLEAWIYPRAYKGYGYNSVKILSLMQYWDSNFGLMQDKWLQPAVPFFLNGSAQAVTNNEWSGLVQLNKWQHVRFTRATSGVVSFWLDNVCVKTFSGTNANGRANDWTFRIGDIDADIDDVRISRVVRAPLPPDEFTADAGTVALYHFNGNNNDSGPNGLHLTAAGNATRTDANLDWMARPSGQSARVTDYGDTLTVTIPDSLLSPGGTGSALTLEAWIFPRAYKAYGINPAALLHLGQYWDSALGVYQDKWLNPRVPFVTGGATTVLSNTQWNSSVALNAWQYLKVTRDTAGVVNVWLGGTLLSTTATSPAYGRTNDWTFTIGSMDADVDEVRISNIVR